MARTIPLGLTICLLFLNLSVINGQGRDEPDKDKAKECMVLEDYNCAIKQFTLLLQQDTTNLDFMQDLAFAYLLGNTDKTKAVPFFEHLTKQDKVKEEMWLGLAKAYHHAHRFDEALTTFKKYKTLIEGKDDLVAQVEREIETVIYAKELVKYKLPVKFENLGDKINSEDIESHPFVPKDESFLIYTYTSRSRVPGYEGELTSDVYMAKDRFIGWSNGRGISSRINSEQNEVSVGLSADGVDLLVAKVDFLVGVGDIFLATRYDPLRDKINRSFRELLDLGEKINSKAFETGATITPDKEILIFSSDMEGGHGGKDLYMSKRLPFGWGVPINLGPVINTQYDDDYPSLSADGKTLYFSSLGHNSMGGMDIFKSEWDRENNTFSKPQNVGYPVNSTWDDKTISFDETGRYAYMAKYREDSYGDLDIYRLTFNNKDSKYTVFNLTMIAPDSTTINNGDFINVLNKETGDFTDYLPNPNTGVYTIILAPGEYVFTSEIPGYDAFNRAITVYGKSGYQPFIRQAYMLTPVGSGSSTPKK